MSNFSGAVKQQKLVVPKIPEMLSYMFYSFHRDEVVEGAGNTRKFSVLSMAAYRMAGRREDLKKLERKDGWIGTFLKATPDVESASPVQVKPFSGDDIFQFRKRIRLTEARIRDAAMVRSLKTEIDRIETLQIAPPDWSFSRVQALAKRALSGADYSNVHEDSEPEFVLSYEVGDMVTVNCGASVNCSTPFCLGRIEDVSTAIRRGRTLKVRWYETVRTKKTDRILFLW